MGRTAVVRLTVYATATFAVACALGLLSPTPVHALTVSAAPNVLRAATANVVLTGAEPTGTVSLLVDGRVADTQAAVPGGTAVFSAIPLANGSHTIQGMLTPSEIPDSALLSAAIEVRSWERPAAPTRVTPSSSSLTARKVHVSARAGAQTTRMSLYVNERLISTRVATPGSTVRWSYVNMPRSRNTIRVEAGNPVAATPISRRTLRRLPYPSWSTCIIIDKSDYKLYWIRRNILIRVYPIAHGKHNCTPVAIWRIDAKYKTSPGSVSGPRKMRLFRRHGSAGNYHYVFTPYGIHGTNQEWVIGTQASHGCIRMYNKDALALWPQVPIHTMVETRK